MPFVIVTRFKPRQQPALTRSEKDFLEKRRKEGKIQYSEMPQDIATDIISVFRVEYSTLGELKKKLREGFKVRKEK